MFEKGLPRSNINTSEMFFIYLKHDISGIWHVKQKDQKKMLEDVYDYSEEQAIHYNPYRHLHFESEAIRDLVKQCNIKDLCKQYFPPQFYQAIAD